MATKNALGERIPVEEQIKLTRKKQRLLAQSIIAYRTLFKDTLQRMLEEKGIEFVSLAAPCAYTFNGITVSGRISFELNTQCGAIPFSNPLNPFVLCFKSNQRDDGGHGMPYIIKKFETSEDDYFAYVARAVLPCLSPLSTDTMFVQKAEGVYAEVAKDGNNA